jgi:hypothetical protein
MMSEKYKFYTCVDTHVDTVEQAVVVGFVFFEDSNVLEHLGVDGNTVIISNGVFAKEIENNEVRCFQGDVLTTKGAATDGVGFVFTLLITSTKGESIDEIHGCRTLSVSHDFTFEIVSVLQSNSFDVFLGAAESVKRGGYECKKRAYFEFPRLFKFGHIALTLQRAASGEENILVIPVYVLGPIGKPCYGLVVYDFLPRSWSVGHWDGRVFTNVKRDILWTNTKLRANLLMPTW